MLDGVRRWLVDKLAGDILAERLAAIGETKVRDQDGWQSLIRERQTEDRNYVEWAEDVKDALEAWRKNFLIRQIVRLTTNYVVGDGIGLSSDLPTVERFIRAWWDHPLNRMSLRLAGMCDELTRAGELFPVLFKNPSNSMTYIRFIPARQIDKIDTGKEDLEKELRYHRLGTLEDVQGKWWPSLETAEADDPVTLHYAINRPIGCVRGEGDLVPIIPWSKRYSAWLKDRIRLNRARTQGGLWDVTISDDAEVEKKRKQYGQSPPEHGAMIIHGPGEEWKALNLNIEGTDASADGKVIRLAVASGAGVPLHFLSEGESATKATAAEMGGPTFRHYRQRQNYFIWMLKDIVGTAYRLSGKRNYTDLRIKATVPDMVPGDNKDMAISARQIVQALAEMKANGWVTDEWAINLAFRFAGEILSEEEIQRILEAGNGNGSRESEDNGE